MTSGVRRRCNFNGRTDPSDPYGSDPCGPIAYAYLYTLSWTNVSIIVYRCKRHWIDPDPDFHEMSLSDAYSMEEILEIMES